MQTMTRAEAVDKLMGRYAGYFDISPAEEEQAPLVATCDFHALSEKYVLSRKPAATNMCTCFPCRT